MRILVLSDSHQKSIDIDLRGYDYILDLGDYGNSYSLLISNNAYIVRGNCDNYGEKIKSLLINNKKVILTHGDLFDVKYDLNKLFYFGKEQEASIVFFGHTHNQEYYRYDDLYLINPGAYKNNEYAIIENNYLYFYKNNVIVNKYELKW